MWNCCWHFPCSLSVTPIPPKWSTWGSANLFLKGFHWPERRIMTSFTMKLYNLQTNKTSHHTLFFFFFFPTWIAQGKPGKGFLFLFFLLCFHVMGIIQIFFMDSSIVHFYFFIFFVVMLSFKMFLVSPFHHKQQQNV